MCQPALHLNMLLPLALPALQRLLGDVCVCAVVCVLCVCVCVCTLLTTIHMYFYMYTVPRELPRIARLEHSLKLSREWVWVEELTTVVVVWRRGSDEGR